jgi:hypothetical protein
MTVEKFQEDVAKARAKLVAATEDVMALVRAGKAFGERWDAAIERERQAHKRMQGVLNSPLISSGGGKQEP